MNPAPIVVSLAEQPAYYALYALYTDYLVNNAYHREREYFAKLREIVNDPQIRFEIEPGGDETAPSASLTSDFYSSLSRVAKQQFPGTAVLPFMSTGATDSAVLRMHGVAAYGLDTFPLPEEEFQRMHADNERIPLDAFRKGVDFLYAIVNDFAVAK